MITFIGISILVIVTPGPDTALTIRNAPVAGAFLIGFGVRLATEGR